MRGREKSISLVGDLMGWTPDRLRKSFKNRVFIQFENVAFLASMIPIWVDHIHLIRLF